MMSPNQKTLLQATRGFASMMVVLFHVSAMSVKYFQYNFLGVANIGRSGGVDYFFVLTGFLMMYLYGEKIGSGTSVVQFLFKRLVRIYPFYWLVTLVVLPVYFVVPSFGYGYETQKDTILHSFLLLPHQHDPILPVAWSLRYFVFFYLMTALMMRLRKKWAYAIGAVWLGLSVCNLLHVPMISSDIQRHLYLKFVFDESSLEFAAGTVIAVLAKKYRFNAGRPFIIAALLLYLSIWVNNKFGVIPYHDNILYILPASLFLLGVMSKPSAQSLASWLRPLFKLGDASFSVLLTHLAIVSVCMKLLKTAHASYHIGYLGDALFVLVCTFPLCLLIHEWVEKPLTGGLRNLVVKKLSGAPSP